MPIHELIVKNTGKDLSLNNILNTSNLSNRGGNIIPNIACNSSNNRKEKIDSDKNNQEKNVIKNGDIPNTKENKPLETTMNDIATKLKDLTDIVYKQSSIKSDYMESQTKLNKNLSQYIESQKEHNNNLATYMQNLNQYMKAQSSYNQKLDKYLANQSNLNEKINKFLGNQYSKRK